MNILNEEEHLQSTEMSSASLERLDMFQNWMVLSKNGQKISKRNEIRCRNLLTNWAIRVMTVWMTGFSADLSCILGAPRGSPFLRQGVTSADSKSRPSPGLVPGGRDK